MMQTFEFYTVDPESWKDDKLITNVKSCSISRDYEADTLGSATFDIDESLGECYIRVYLITIQNGVKEKHPLGTFLIQTPSLTFNGMYTDISMDAYTPLLELKEKQPPIGYYVPKNSNVMDQVCLIMRDKMRAPMVSTTADDTLYSDYVADANESWLSFLIDLAAYAKYEIILDEIGRVLFAPKQDTASLQPIWTYDDSNSSILYPEITLDHDLYDVPNVVEILYSSSNDVFYSRVVNDDPNSPISTVKRGREIVRRITNPEMTGDPTQERIDEYAKQLLEELSSLEYTISYTHGYCPVRIGDCVRLNYERAGITNVKAKVISQNIKCEPGCPVSETAVFTVKLWG
jgi:hypothetical protein